MERYLLRVPAIIFSNNGRDTYVKEVTEIAINLKNIMMVRPVLFDFAETDYVNKENCYEIIFLCENALENSIVYIRKDVAEQILGKIELSEEDLDES